MFAYFGVYDPTVADTSYLYSLGALEMPHQGSQEGLNVPRPADVNGHRGYNNITVLDTHKSAKDA